MLSEGASRKVVKVIVAGELLTSTNLKDLITLEKVSANNSGYIRVIYTPSTATAPVAVPSSTQGSSQADYDMLGGGKKKAKKSTTKKSTTKKSTTKKSTTKKSSKKSSKKQAGGSKKSSKKSSKKPSKKSSKKTSKKSSKKASKKSSRK